MILALAVPREDLPTIKVVARRSGVVDRVELGVGDRVEGAVDVVAQILVDVVDDCLHVVPAHVNVEVFVWYTMPPENLKDVEMAGDDGGLTASGITSRRGGRGGWQRE